MDKRLILEGCSVENLFELLRASAERIERSGWNRGLAHGMTICAITALLGCIALVLVFCVGDYRIVQRRPGSTAELEPGVVSDAGVPPPRPGSPKNPAVRRTLPSLDVHSGTGVAPSSRPRPTTVLPSGRTRCNGD